MSSPRLEPWLIPDTISSGGSPSSPRSANRTQSTGVPSVAYPVSPSANVTSSTHSGERVVMLRAVALRFESGAITCTSSLRDRGQRPAQRLQALSLDPVVVGDQNLHASILGTVPGTSRM